MGFPILGATQQAVFLGRGIPCFPSCLYPPGIKHGNGKSPMNEGFQGKIINSAFPASHI